MGVYNKLEMENMCLTSSQKNRWIFTKSTNILKIINFTKREDTIVMFATELKILDDIYLKPIKSS